MDTPDKCKLVLINCKNTLNIGDISKEFDSIKLFQCDIHEVALYFYLSRKVIHFIKLTKRVSKISLEKSPLCCKITFCPKDPVRKPIIATIKASLNSKRMEQRVYSFVSSVKKYFIYSIDKNDQKLVRLPKIYERRHSFTPVDKLSRSPFSRTNAGHYESNAFNINQIRKRLSFGTNLSPKLTPPDSKRTKRLRFAQSSPALTDPSPADENRGPDSTEDDSKNFLRRSLSLGSRKFVNRFKSVDSAENGEPLLTASPLSLSVQGSGKRVSAVIKVVTESPPEKYGDKVGFVNSGNICYINSVMQALLGLGGFRKKVVELVRTGLFGENTICGQIGRCIYQVKRKNSSVSLSTLKNVVSEKNSVFVGERQQDAHEFLTSLLDEINQELSLRFANSMRKVGERKDLDRIDFLSDLLFYCPITRKITCTKCKLKRDSLEENYHLSLHFPASGLEADLSDKAESEEKTKRRETHPRSCKDIVSSDSEGFSPARSCPVHGDAYLQMKANRKTSERFFACRFSNCPFTANAINRLCEAKDADLALNKDSNSFSVQKLLRNYFEPRKTEFVCDSCRNDAVLIEQLISKLPSVLILHLKRFCFRRKEHSGDFFDEQSVFKLKRSVHIDLGIDLFDFVGAPEGAVETEQSSSQIGEGGLCYKYRLKSIVYHKGETPDSGHYVADVFDVKKAKWFSFDDEKIQMIHEEDLNNRVRRESCYILFYEKALGE